MVGEGVGLEREGQPLIGSFALYTAIGSHSQPWKLTPTNSYSPFSNLDCNRSRSTVPSDFSGSTY